MTCIQYKNDISDTLPIHQSQGSEGALGKDWAFAHYPFLQLVTVIKNSAGTIARGRVAVLMRNTNTMGNLQDQIFSFGTCTSFKSSVHKRPY